MPFEEKFEMRPELTGVALAYRNKGLIADEIFPTVPVDTKSFQYRFYNKSSFVSVPETIIGETGIPNRVRLDSKLLTETCEDHALTERIPVARIKQAQKSGKGENLEATATMQLTDLLKLSREVNLARKLTTKSNFGSNCKEMSDKEKFTDDTFNAHKALTSAMDKVFYRPNILVTSREGFSALSQNPYVVSAVNSVDVKAGIASIEGIKRTYGLDKVLIGEGNINITTKGQTPQFKSCWGNDVILMHVNPIATSDYGITFGYQAVNEGLQVLSYSDPEAGTQGCEVLKAYSTYLDLITCPECGYLLKNVA